MGNCWGLCCCIRRNNRAVEPIEMTGRQEAASNQAQEQVDSSYSRPSGNSVAPQSLYASSSHNNHGWKVAQTPTILRFCYHHGTQSHCRLIRELHEYSSGTKDNCHGNDYKNISKNFIIVIFMKHICTMISCY